MAKKSCLGGETLQRSARTRKKDPNRVQPSKSVQFDKVFLGESEHVLLDSAVKGGKMVILTRE